jgi:hypothetical protein
MSPEKPLRRRSSLTPVKCWYLGGLDQWFGPYPGTPEAAS